MKTTVSPLNKERTPIKKSLFYRVVKRIMDITLSLIGLIVLSPLFLAVSLAIVIEDGGPVVFKQQRVGKNKKIFNMYKFRSMRKNSDEIRARMNEEYGMTGIGEKLKDKQDPRVTRVGRFIRKTNIDELPQLINIIKGEMSIVGPRPYIISEIVETEKIHGDKFDERFDVLPGLTCYWQATFSKRCEISFDQRMQMDVDYANEANLRIDIKLIFTTAIYSIIGKAGY